MDVSTCPRCGFHELSKEMSKPSSADPAQLICASCGLHERFEDEFLASLSRPRTGPCCETRRGRTSAS
jgi:transcription elongation factor Elf1